MNINLGFIDQIINFTQTLTHKELQKYIIIVISSVALICAASVYYVYHLSSNAVKKIETINSNANKVNSLLGKHETLKNKEEEVIAILDKNKDFKISTFFENFYKKHKVTPEPNWKPEDGTKVEGSEEGTIFQEILLQATFKNQNMKTLVDMVQEIYKINIIYIKDLEISKEPKNKINFTITLATKQYSKTEEA